MRLPRRFSLRSLLLLILAGASVAAVVLKWDAWKLTLALIPTGKAVENASFSPDGRFIVANAIRPFPESEEIQRTVVWNRSGEELYRTDWCVNLRGGFSGAEFKLGTRWLLLSYGHFGVNSQLVDMQSRAALFPENCNSGHVAFTPDERRCAVAFSDQDRNNYWLAACDLESGKLLREERAFFLEIDECREACISPDGRRVIAVGEEPHENSARAFLICFDVETGAIARSNPAYESLYIENLAFAAGGTRVVLLNSSEIRVLDAATDKILFERRGVKFGRYHHRDPRGLAHILFQSENSVFHLDLQAKTLVPVHIPRVLLNDAEQCGEWVAWHDGANVRLRNFVTGWEPASTLIHVRQGESWNVQWDNYGYVIFTSSDKQNYCFDPNTKRIFRSSDEMLPSPDGSRILIGVNPGRVFAWGADGPPRGILNNPKAKGGRAHWSPDSNAVITSGDGRHEARVWTRMRNDEPYALLWLPETILAVVLVSALMVSVRSDLRGVGNLVDEEQTKMS